MAALCISRESNRLYFNDIYLAKEVVVDILTRLGIEDVKKARLVCKQWRFMIDDPLFWKRKTKEEGRYFPRIPLDDSFQWRFYASIYLNDPFGRNLIKNPNGKGINKKNTFSFWQLNNDILAYFFKRKIGVLECSLSRRKWFCI